MASNGPAEVYEKHGMCFQWVFHRADTILTPLSVTTSTMLVIYQASDIFVRRSDILSVVCCTAQWTVSRVQACIAKSGQ